MRKVLETDGLCLELMEYIVNLGYTELVLKGDGESALVQVMNDVKRQRPHKTILEHPPAYDLLSNGAVEKAVDQFMCQFRAIKIGLERRIGKRVETNWPVLTWVAEHAAMMLNRYQVGRDGRTAYRRTVRERMCSESFVEFGEQVHVKHKRRPQTNRKQSLDSKWKTGTWVGMTSRSNEHIVIIPDGGLGFAIRARTVRRMSVDQRWNSDAIEHTNATVKTTIPKIKEIAEPAAGETSVVCRC